MRIIILNLILLIIVNSVSAATLKTDNSLPLNASDILIYLGQEQENRHAIIVDKATQTLFLYTHNDQILLEKQYVCSTGEKKGAKQKSGDSKTPEGVYFFVKDYPDRDLSETYGTRAFPMDYPNVLDRINGHTGNSIWLHGTNKPITPRDSNGCMMICRFGCA